MITAVTLTQTYPAPNPSGSAPTGVVRIDLARPMTDTSTGVVSPARTVFAQIVAGALVPVTIDATDDPTTEPVGTVYHFTEQVDGAPIREWDAPIPHAAPGGTMTLAATYAAP